MTLARFEPASPAKLPQTHALASTVNGIGVNQVRESRRKRCGAPSFPFYDITTRCLLLPLLPFSDRSFKCVLSRCNKLPEYTALPQMWYRVVSVLFFGFGSRYVPVHRADNSLLCVWGFFLIVCDLETSMLELGCCATGGGGCNYSLNIKPCGIRGVRWWHTGQERLLTICDVTEYGSNF
jgi:hypothetical protein